MAPSIGEATASGPSHSVGQARGDTQCYATSVRTHAPNQECPLYVARVVPSTALLLAASVAVAAPPTSPGDLQPVITNCAVSSGYAVQTWVGEAASEALWVAGVYEAQKGHKGGSHPVTEAQVAFDLPGDNVLALSAYEPVTWQVKLGAGAALTEIVLIGYHDQKVEGVEGIPVRVLPKPSCGFRWGVEGKSCAGEELVAALTEATGRKASRFDGCYRASSFQFRTAPPPDDAP